MKEKILALCILATLVLTACVEKEQPIVGDGDVSESSSQESIKVIEAIEAIEANSEVNSSESDVSSKNQDNPSKSEKSDSDYTQFPQEVLDYCENSNMDIKIESRRYGESEDSIADVYKVYLDDLGTFNTVGAIIDITNEEYPKILYHYAENAQNITSEEENSTGYSTYGRVFAVKFNDDNVVTEFISDSTASEPIFLSTYVELKTEMNN